MKRKKFKIECLNLQDIGVMKLMLLQLMRGNWYGAGREVVMSERRCSTTYDAGRLVKGLQALGVNRGLTPSYLRRIIDVARQCVNLDLPVERVEGLPLVFVERLLAWYDSGLLGRQDLERVMYYRQLHFHNRHDVGMHVFELDTPEHVETLKKMAYQCEPFMLLA